MISVMMQLGQFKFSLSTAAYQAFTRNSVFRWQAQERFGRFPAQQYTGPGEDTITLAGDIYPSFAGDLFQIADMRDMAFEGVPLLLVDGNGYVWGRWVIQSVDDAQETFFSDGTARKFSFVLKITRYGEDL